MKTPPSSIQPLLCLLALAAGTPMAAEPLSAPGLSALRIERGVLYRDAPLLTTGGGSPPYTFVFDASGLPPGLRLDARGLLSGITCSIAGRFALGQVSVTDAAGARASAGLPDTPLHDPRAGGCTLAVGSTWQASSLGQPFRGLLRADGGQAPVAFSVIAGQLPAGLVLSPNGAISGTPTTAASHRFTVLARDAQGATGVHDAVLNVIALDVSPATLAPGSVGDAYSQALSTTGGSAPYSYVVSAGSLPAGLILSRNGRITGTPTTAGTARFTVTATDAAQVASTRSYTLRVGSAQHASASAYRNASEAARAQSSLAARGAMVHHYAAAPTAPAPNHPVRALGSGAAAEPDAADRLADPASDAAVSGLQVAEVEALKRLSAAQLRNVRARLDGDVDCRPEWQQLLHLNTAWRDTRPAGLATEAPPADKPGCTGSLSGWAAGTVDYGRVPGAMGAAGSRFSSPGLSAGIDLAPLQGVRSGIALGHGRDRSDVNGELGRIDSRSDSITAYGSWEAPLGVRVHAALGQQRTLLERLRDAGADTLLPGVRRVTQRFGTLAGSTRVDVGPWTLAPRLGLEHMSAALGAFVENDTSPLALAYDGARLASSDVRGGLAVTRQWRPALWTVEPELSVDWHRRLQGGMTQPMRPADDPFAPAYSLSSTEPTTEFAQFGVGVRMRHPLGWSMTLGARSTLDAGALRNAGYNAAMHWPF
ncbi:MAG: autotransporter domain-containing protein [Burkholderiaceae bacterium]|nr:autotransporter domain-containing protein [Burkholderiaceae bacterium]